MDPDGNQMCVFIYDKRWQAQAAMQLILKSDELDWRSDDYVQSSSGVVLQIRRVRTTPCTLLELWERERKVSEMALELEDHQRRELKIFREGKLPEMVPERVQRERKAKTPRADAPAGSIHISVIALQMGVEPRQARAAARKVFTKPAHGWSWLPSEIDDVKSKLTDALK
jgi:hypothetical protein